MANHYPSESKRATIADRAKRKAGVGGRRGGRGELGERARRAHGDGATTHDFVPIGQRWRCTQRKEWSKSQSIMLNSRCTGSAQTKRAMAIVRAEHSHGTLHFFAQSCDISWCICCGAYAQW